MLFWLFGTFIIAYTIGSIPFGIILTKLFGYGDLREIGSGNIGATNAFRTGNKLLGILTLLLDATKGYVAVGLCFYYYGHEYAAIGALFVVLGHVFPVWLSFKGGKGVATAIGVFFALNWMLAAIVCFLWLAVFFITRISSISSLVSVGYSSIMAYILPNNMTISIDNYMLALLCLCISTLIIFTHRNNIIRLMIGTESNFKKVKVTA